MPRSLNGKPALLTRLVESDALIDHVLIAPFETVMLASMLHYELCQPVRSYTVGNNRAARMLFQYYSRNEGYERVAVDGLSLA